MQDVLGSDRVVSRRNSLTYLEESTTFFTRWYAGWRLSAAKKT